MKILFQLNRAYYAVPFPTVHRVVSQGYIVYRTAKSLKPEYCGLPGPEIGARRQKGEEVYDVTEVPEVAFTGW